SFYFFFQAEDGIRDGHVTGVQTCALPICQPCEKRLSRQYEPRAAYPPQRHHRIQRNAGGGDARFREAGKSAGPAEDSIGWQALKIGRASCRERVKIWEGDGTGKKKGNNEK